MSDDLERRLRDALRRTDLPAAPSGLQMRLDELDQHPTGSTRGPSRIVWAVVVPVVAIMLLGLSGLIGGGPTPSVAPPSFDGGKSPTASSTASAPPVALAKGVVAEVVKPFSLVTDRGVVVGQRVYVADGPTQSDGRPSFLIQHWGDLDHGLRPDSDFGWLSVDDATASLQPVEVDCPGAPLTLGAIATLQPFERLVCFGGQQVELGPLTTREFRVGLSSPNWLSADGSVDFPTAIPYVRSGPVASLDEALWYRLVGHFDDPQCDRESDPVRNVRCRQLFVLTSATTTDPPVIFLHGTWRRMAESPLSGRTGAASAWSGTELFVWGGGTWDGSTSEYVADGAGYDPVADRWQLLPPAPINGRYVPFGAWTGSAFLVWGGSQRRGDVDTARLDGALFDPATGGWKQIPPAPLEGSTTETSATWTGSELVVFSERMRSGAAFDVAAGRWRSIALPPLDPGDSFPAIPTWTGTELIVLGHPIDDVDTSMAWAAAWDPASDRWRSLSEPGFRSIDGGPAVWTGREVIVLWGANRAFDPATDQWRTISNPCGAAAGGAWTGRYSIQYGKAFDTVTETCRNLPLEPERPGGGFREFGVDVWTGTELIRWSGGNGGDGAPRMNDGVAFDPKDDLGR